MKRRELGFSNDVRHTYTCLLYTSFLKLYYTADQRLKGKLMPDRKEVYFT